MPLAPGTRLGAYEIVSPLGAGGMGEVYRARDTKLGREVAVKILPRAFATDSERLQRFEREARLLASLNHPHIGAIYGVEEADGVRALVLELIEGDTLADRVHAGPVPMTEALTIARQICDALDAAHERGIVHRDLKPANIKITPDGVVKVLDFGLAKGTDGSKAELTQSPTMLDATESGMLLGTAHYMSPEQARGRPVDRRTDIWAFGCVLFEMLAGRRAFPGDTVSDAIAALLEREPDWTALPAVTPGSLRRLLERCLEKDQKRRLRDIADVRRDVEDAVNEPIAPAPQPPSSGQRPWRTALFVSAAAVLVAVTVVVGTRQLRDAPPMAKAVTRFSVDVPAGGFLNNAAAVSSDGTKLAFNVIFQDPRKTQSQLYLRRLDQLEPTMIPAADVAFMPFFSPDGLSVGFFAGGSATGTLKTVSLVGGAPVRIAEAKWRGGSWSADNTILFTPSPNAGIVQIPAGGGTAQTLTVPDQQHGERNHQYPQRLPGDAGILFTILGTDGDSRIAVQSLGAGGRRVLIDRGDFARYAPTGHLLYQRGEALLAVPFDVSRLSATGPAVTMLEGLAPGMGFGISATGTLVYAPVSSQKPARQLVVVDRSGVMRPLFDHRRYFGQPKYSADGRRLAVEISGTYRFTDPDIWISDIERGTLTKITSDGQSRSPVWAPDGKSVTYLSGRQNQRRIVSRVIDTGVETTIFEGDDVGRPCSWSSDGRFLVFQRSSGIWLLDSGRARQFLQTRFGESAPALSPDGRWLAYASNESGDGDVYVQAFPDGGRKTQVSVGGGADPMWSRNGRELVYRNQKDGDKFMVASVTTQPAFTPGKPQLWFDVAAQGRVFRSYDVSPDGERLTLVTFEPEELPTKLIVVQNWQEELKHRVPTR